MVSGAQFCRELQTSALTHIASLKQELIQSFNRASTIPDKIAALRAFRQKYHGKMLKVQLSVNNKAVHPISQVAGFIHREMTQNIYNPVTDKIKMMRDGAGSLDSQNQFVAEDPSPWLFSLALWRNQVDTGHVWDHKTTIRTAYGQWSYDPDTSRLYEFDIWSNIHYGYVGAAVGFGESILLFGAAVKQVLDHGLKALAEDGGDDPKDQVAIRIGFALWQQFGPSVQIDDILEAVRTRADALKAEPCTCFLCD